MKTRRRAAIVLEPEPSQSTIQATQRENVQKLKGEILTEPYAVKRLKSEMMTREKKKVAKKARLAPDLREKKLQVGKAQAKPSLKDQKKLVKKASESISHKVVSKDSKQGSSRSDVNGLRKEFTM